ncbi:carboxypeptidase-like regulatory domain-containing protein [Emticicia sp. BO119]|uniref:carboxypeptidase-like regulatory domain-containing protein n=1 Tax=Emticicia sp. BO119 TaxID=2757768 RepID=UPI0015F023DC|nr:carboxypeptidase-like regulatory domain-containing protein [Emticicia sp. BO119]MBA4851271.1 carboxypeptidase-like regulatory domain-containing protein [Emticicia sp. BO119]
MIKKFTFISLLLLTTLEVWSQTTITGQVISRDDKSPIPGVSIVEKGTKNGTTSALDGSFSINVSDTHATLIFGSIGFAWQEYHLKGATQLLVKMKYDCTRDFFDEQRIGIYANSGVLNNPVGGQLSFSFPLIYGAGTLTSSFGLQSDLRNNQFLNAQVGFIHFAVSCDFDMDARWHYREVSYNNTFGAKAYSFETDLNIGKRIGFLPSLNFTVGYGNLNLKTENQSATGPIFGIETYIKTWKSYVCSISGKVGIFKNNIELQGQLARRFKGFEAFIRYYRLKSFSELSLGIGKDFGYRLKRQRMKQ